MGQGAIRAGNGAIQANDGTKDRTGFLMLPHPLTNFEIQRY